MFLFPKDALDRVFKNIISNAKAHGFSDKLRSDYQLRFSWHMDGTALIIEIDNNGSAIPNDRDTASLLEYGVSTNLHKDGHNGIGCSEIDDIMQRYDGKVEIVSLPKEVFPVKYVLTFNRYKTFLDLLNHKRYESVRFDTSSMG
jgi:sensor histidine kinase regulating citrate/malate metabolism